MAIGFGTCGIALTQPRRDIWGLIGGIGAIIFLISLAGVLITLLVALIGAIVELFRH